MRPCPTGGNIILVIAFLALPAHARDSAEAEPQVVRQGGYVERLLGALDPNRELNPAYANYIAVTDDGRSLSGMITAETSTSLTLSRGEGQADTVLRTNIDQMINTGLSLMPEGLEEQLSKQDMADVIEYLMTVESQ